MTRSCLPFLLTASWFFAGCDNVGKAFDPGAGGPGEAMAGIIEVVPEGGTAVDGRPTVKASYPSGAGWPSTVPIVVEFSESVNVTSIMPTTATGTDGRIGVRLMGSMQLLPCQYDFLANGRLLVMRPLMGLTGPATAMYQVVLLPDARDVDGVRFSVTGSEKVLTTFQTNQAASITDGRILAVFPRDNAQDKTREGEYFVVFDRPANTGSIVDTNIFLRPNGGDAITATLSEPVTTVGVADPRVVSIRPDTPLSAARRYELVVTADITFGMNGVLDFKNRTPFAVFDTVAPAAPTRVELANPTAMSFANKINRANLTDVRLKVTTPTDTAVGDRVRARIYGLDHTTMTTGDLAFFEREVTTTAAGEQDVELDFAMMLGSVTAPQFDDGEVTFTAAMLRGSQSSGYIHHDASASPAFDITPPTLMRVGPPVAVNNTDVLTDLEYVAFFGSGSEAVSQAMLTIGGGMEKTLWAGGSDGRFMVLPEQVGRSAPLQYSLSLTDRSGNAAGPFAGMVLPRGFVNGTLAGDLTVEAYDEVTLLPIAGATVLVDPGTPQAGGVGQLAMTTNSAGRATFTGLTAPSHTVTIVRAGYSLITLYDTQGAFVSLPLVPNTGATASLSGTLAFTPTPGATGIVGATSIADGSVLGIRTSMAAPSTIPSTPILPNRPQVITAFGGSFEPTSSPPFSLHGCQICGSTLVTPTAPNLPAAAGAELAPTLALLPATVATVVPLVNARTEDFGLATGLDTMNLVGGNPKVRIAAALQGFRGQALVGVGWVTGSTGTMFDCNAYFSLPLFAGMVSFGGLMVLVIEAEDTAGHIARTRSVVNVTANIIAGPGPSPIPLITPPSGPSVGSPAVTFADVLAPVPSLLLTGWYDVEAVDPAGRHWKVLVPDRDAVGGARTIQFPDLAAHSVQGLQAGDWSLRVEARQVLAVFLDEFTFTERFRSEVNYSRGLAVTFQVQ